MAGFAAATYLRGIPFVPIPTTLLSMVDASVGGKVAVDLPQGKNLVGAFSQPLQVLLDPGYLDTLPVNELRGGLVEIIKAGIIDDPVLFSACEADGELPAWRWLIEHALAVKIKAVEQDPYESGQRAVLNLGHTFGHAFEVLANYTLPHGLAVSVGLAAAAELGRIRGHCDASVCDRIISALQRRGLPVTWSGSSPGAVLAAMKHDKKRVDARLRFVLPAEIGKVVIDDSVSEPEILQSIERITP
jgi:3-dehydroquinate synthetase